MRWRSSAVFSRLAGWSLCAAHIESVNVLLRARRFLRRNPPDTIGLRRRGFSTEEIRRITHAFRLLLAAKLNTSQALEKLHKEGDLGADVAMLLRFIETSERGTIK